jgi:hypothetical protein
VKNILLYDVDFIDIRGVKRIRGYFANNPDSAEAKARSHKDVAKIIGIHKADDSRIPYGRARIRTFEQFVVPVIHGNYLDYPEGAKKIMRHPKDDAYGEFGKKKEEHEYGEYEA